MRGRRKLRPFSAGVSRQEEEGGYGISGLEGSMQARLSHHPVMSEPFHMEDEGFWGSITQNGGRHPTPTPAILTRDRTRNPIRSLWANCRRKSPLLSVKPLRISTQSTGSDGNSPLTMLSIGFSGEENYLDMKNAFSSTGQDYLSPSLLSPHHFIVCHLKGTTLVTGIWVVFPSQVPPLTPTGVKS